METLQLIHIVAELVILIALFVFFNNKINNLHNQVNILTKKLQEQEEILRKHDELFAKLY